jgi:hypothetical protein
MNTLICFFIVYILVLLFLLAVTYLKIKRKDKYTFWLWVLICYVVILPILYFCTIGYFSSSTFTSIYEVK